MRKFLILLMISVLLSFTACGSSDGDASNTQESGAEAQAEQVEEVEEEPAVHPYAWLGLQDMPECNYLDILATYHYIQTYDAYTMSICSEVTEAVDGINSFTDNAGTKAYSVDGHITSINENSKIYMEQDMGGTAEDALKRFKDAKESGTNVFGRNFLGTGTDVVPGIEDSTEYEYYEYDYPDTEAAGSGKILERFYMKDGDVFAIYKKTTTSSGSEVEYTQVIKSISGDIPEGTFDLPDLSEYTKYES